MGDLEQTSRKRTRKNQLSALVLESVKTAGLLSLMIVAPNVIGSLAKLGIITTRQHPAVIKRTATRLAKAGLLEWRGSSLCITKKGEHELHRLALRSRARVRPKQWDGKWRVVIFDIPERRKGLRQRLKNMLRDTGFVRLQNSVWVYPYDSEDFVALLKADFRIGDDVRYMIVETIERDDALRSQFKLA